MSKKRTTKATGKQRSGKRTNGSGQRAPRSQVLPGLEQVRDTTLESCCEYIGAAREVMNAARGDEQAAIQRAIKRMLKSPQQPKKYLFAGVELALVEGVDKLRVRLRKDAEDTASVEGPSEEELEAESDESGEG